MHFNTAVEPTTGSEQSPRPDTISREPQSGGKRKVDSTIADTKSQIERKKAEKSRKRRKVSVYDAVAGRSDRVKSPNSG